MNLYTSKDRNYFSNARTEIQPFLPEKNWGAASVLEIGCAEGFTLAWLKKIGYCSWSAGIDPYVNVDLFESGIDYFSNVDIEKNISEISIDAVDLILCLDVLEHLVNPWQTLQLLTKFLKPGGRMIISLPNVRNYHVVTDLAIRGEFKYTESGILDQTHLRFFTKSSAIAMINSAELRVVECRATESDRWQKKLMKYLGLEELTAKQFIFAAERF